MKAIIKKFIPIGKIKLILSKLMQVSLRVAASNSFTAKLYYLLISKEFNAEQLAVLKGREAYHSGKHSQHQALILLRRNIHRLEKGLIMRPRRSSFAAGYILETTQAYLNCTKKKIGEDAELKWATDVLNEFFSIIDITDHANFSVAYKQYCSIIDHSSNGDSLNGHNQTQCNETAFVPYAYTDLPELTTRYQDLDILFKHRRSVRWYQQQPVPQELIHQAVKHASLAPSACNRQPFRFYTAIEQKKATQLAKLAMGTAGFADNIPCLIAVVGDLSAYPFERDRHVIYIDGSLAAMQLMLSLETLGLSSCPINWPDIPERDHKLSQQLQLNAYEKVIMLIAVGYADESGSIPYSQKKSSEQLLKFV